MAEIIANHVNSEGEIITIRRCTDGEFAGQLLLVIHDDGPLDTEAPTLLDEGTQEWLLSFLLSQKERAQPHPHEHDHSRQNAAPEEAPMGDDEDNVYCCCEVGRPRGGFCAPCWDGSCDEGALCETPTRLVQHFAAPQSPDGRNDG